MEIRECVLDFLLPNSLFIRNIGVNSVKPAGFLSRPAIKLFHIIAHGIDHRGLALRSRAGFRKCIEPLALDLKNRLNPEKRADGCRRRCNASASLEIHKKPSA